MRITHPLSTSLSPWWALWTLAFSAIWLIPNWSEPWLTFDRELLTTVLGLILAAVVLIKGSARWEIPLMATIPMALAAVALVQWATGLVEFGGDAEIAALYLCGFSLSIVLGLRMDSVFRKDWLHSLFISIAIAAIVSVGISLNQWLGIEGLSLWIIDMPPGARPFGNIGQPNLLATLLCWGLVAIWWLLLHRHIGGKVAWLAAAYLLFGIVMTQSRTGWLVVLMLAGAGLAFHRQLEMRRYWPGSLVLLLAFIFAAIFWSQLNQALFLTSPTSFGERLQPGTRLAHWNSMLDAIKLRPLTGWGWNQVGVAQQAVAPTLPAVGELIGYSHNVVLDLLVWNGIPIGGAVVVTFGMWLWSKCRRPSDSTSVLLLIAICAFVVHAMLEYPHAYTFMLFPVGMLMGVLSHRSAERPVAKVPRIAACVCVAALAGMTAWTAHDYYDAKASVDALRFELARIGTSRDSKPPDLKLLTQLKALSITDRMKISASISDDELELLRRTSERYPAERLIMHYAAAAAARGDGPSASLALTKLCKLYPVERCVFARQIWEHWAANQFPFLKAVPFPSAGAM